jgi:hypothetical protein
MREHTNNLMHRDPRSADACLAMADLWAYGHSVIHRITVARPSFRLKHILRRIQCNDAFAIPVPLVFVFSKHTLKASLKADWRQKVSRGFAEDPFAVLSKEEKAQMTAAHSALLRKFTDLAFDESAEVRWQESRPTEADNIDVRPTTETDLQNDLIDATGNPF